MALLGDQRRRRGRLAQLVVLSLLFLLFAEWLGDVEQQTEPLNEASCFDCEVLRSEDRRGEDMRRPKRKFATTPRGKETRPQSGGNNSVQTKHVGLFPLPSLKEEEEGK